MTLHPRSLHGSHSLVCHFTLKLSVGYLRCRIWGRSGRRNQAVDRIGANNNTDFCPHPGHYTDATLSDLCEEGEPALTTQVRNLSRITSLVVLLATPAAALSETVTTKHGCLYLKIITGFEELKGSFASRLSLQTSILTAWKRVALHSRLVIRLRDRCLRNSHRAWF